jgi:diphthamide synthase (EF-2-diphthine--ammonia ligase)
MKKKILLAWSSGKDSAWALHVLRQQNQYEIAGLMTTFNAAFDRVAMHSTRRALVEMQAEAAGLPLIAVPIPWPCSNADYESAMKRVCDQALAQGITAIAFGDLFLTDVRAYRERQLKDTGLEPLFPIWDIPTHALAQEMISALGFAQSLSVWILSKYLPVSSDATLTSHSFMIFPQEPIPAARTASSIPLFMRDRCSIARFQS